MKLILKINGEKRSFESGKITMRQFKKASSLHKAFLKEELFGENYPESDYDTAISFICERFNNKFTEDEFWDGFELEDSTDFFTFFYRVLQDVQTNEEKQELMNELQQQVKTLKGQDENGKDLPPSDD